MEERVRRIGIEKIKDMNNDFDQLYEKYKKKAIEMGYEGDLKYVKSHGKIEIFAVINKDVI
jgi:hypothetical protein